MAHPSLTFVALLKHDMLNGTFVLNTTACQLYLLYYYKYAWKYPSSFKPVSTDLQVAYYLPIYIFQVWI